MKIRIGFKTPDAVDDALAACALSEPAARAARIKLDRWVEYGEYITLEFDTETGVLTPLPVK